MNKILTTLLLLCIFVLSSAYLLDKQPTQSSNHLKNSVIVSASFYPIWYFASQIGGEKATVFNITPAGSEPHDYDPTTQDIANIENGNLLIVNGIVEAWGSKIKENLSNTQVTIVEAGKGLFSQTIEEEGEKQLDPHVWLDPLRAKQEADIIMKNFQKVDPTNKNYYQMNEQLLANKLDQLDREYQEGLGSCKQNTIVTSHNAFGYLANRYEFKQISIAGFSPDEEPSAKQLAQVIKYIKLHNIKYVFFESLISPKLSDTIAEETGAQTLVLDPIEGLSDDAIRHGNDYFSLMEQNLKNLKLAMECK